MRFTALLCTLVFAAILARAGECTPLAHWDFDGVTDGAIADRARGHDAAIVGHPPEDFIQPGVYGMAAFFDNGEWSARIAPSQGTALEDAFTIIYAIRPFSVAGFRTILWKGDRTVTPEAVNYYADLRDGKVELKTKDREGKWIVYSTPPVVEAGRWYLVMIAFDGGQVGIWVNGDGQPVTVAEDGQRARALVANAHAVTLGAGANRTGTAYSFWGLIDEITILPEVRSGFTSDELADWQHRVARYEGKVHAYRTQRLFARLDAVAKRLTGQDTRGRAAVIREAISASASLCPGEGAIEHGRIKGLIDRLAFRHFFQVHAPKRGARFIAAPMGTYERIVKRPNFFEGLDVHTRVVQLEAARNEYEGFQVVLIANADDDVRGVTVDVGEFRCGEHRLDRERIEWGRLEAIRTEKPDIPVDFVGEIPDMIVEDEPAVEVGRGDFTTIFFRLYVPEDAHAGLYKGAVRVACDTTTVTLPVQLHVHPFALPGRPSLPMAFSFFERYYCDWYGWSALTAERRVYVAEFLMRYRIPLNNIYAHEYCYPPPAELGDLRGRTNFYSSKYYAGSEALAQEELEAIVRTYAKALADARAAGIEDAFYVYLYDEIAFHRGSIRAAKQLTEALRAAWPGVRLMQTSFPTRDIEDLFNVWIPMFQHFVRADNRAQLERLRARGDEIWWYAADAPRHPCPNFFLDYPVFDCRIVGTLSYLYDVSGVLYWSINREWKTNLPIRSEWPAAEWKPYIFHIHTGVRKHKNGMGNLVYPGPEGRLYPSLRLENLRDGIEDYEYLTLLKSAVARVRGIGAAPELVGQAEALLRVPTEVATAVNDYASDPANLLDYRREVARTIVLLDDITEGSRAGH